MIKGPFNDNRRILLVDDHKPIHEDFRDILQRYRSDAGELDEMESRFFGDAVIAPLVLPRYELDSAFQGKEALEKVRAAVETGEPYAMVFVDVRMPPGWDGVETIKRIWAVDPDLQVVICTAYADYTWDEMYRLFGDTDSLVFLRKPFDHTEVRQLASALTEKWNLSRRSRLKLTQLQQLVDERTAELRKTIASLEEAAENVRTLSGLVPICAVCKSIRDDKGFWDSVEVYVAKHTEATFSHGICPGCLERVYPEIHRRIEAKRAAAADAQPPDPPPDAATA